MKFMSNASKVVVRTETHRQMLFIYAHIWKPCIKAVRHGMAWSNTEVHSNLSVAMLQSKRIPGYVWQGLRKLQSGILKIN